MGGWLGGSVAQWVGQVKSLIILINLDIIEIIQFSLKIYHLKTLHPCMGAWVVAWMGGSVGQWVGLGHITKY